MAELIDMTEQRGSGELQLEDVKTVIEVLSEVSRYLCFKNGNASEIKCTLLLTLTNKVLSKSGISQLVIFSSETIPWHKNIASSLPFN